MQQKWSGKWLGPRVSPDRHQISWLHKLQTSRPAKCRVHKAQQDIEKLGTLTVTAGRANRQHYVLSSKLTVIGRSELASIRLRRWFAPRIAASIHLREDGYFLVPAGKNIKIRVNNSGVAGGQRELKPGDKIEVAGITAMFDYEG